MTITIRICTIDTNTFGRMAHPYDLIASKQVTLHNAQGDRMSSENNRLVMQMVVIGSVIFLALVYWLAKSIGADLDVTLKSTLYSLGLLVIVFGFQWGTQIAVRPCVSLSIFVAISWFLWWGVLDNIAQKKLDSLSAISMQEIWYATYWGKFGVEACLVGIVLYCITRD